MEKEPGQSSSFGFRRMTRGERLARDISIGAGFLAVCGILAFLVNRDDTGIDTVKAIVTTDSRAHTTDNPSDFTVPKDTLVDLECINPNEQTYTFFIEGDSYLMQATGLVRSQVEALTGPFGEGRTPGEAGDHLPPIRAC